ncbi:MAG TPA: MFS transporter [Thermoleophilaceae bacterium]|nr:MFS transporter [Thermoleophilaceae bacterium]
MSRNVVLLGFTSLLTDVSAEMVTAVLPIYVVLQLGASPLQYGFLDGLYQGASAVVRLGSGVVADRTKRYKDVAALGYGTSAVCKGALLVVGGSIGGLSLVVLADRLGKGIRTAPRDALISLSSTRDRLATSFGVHRAMDTAGAMLGPLVAFGLLLAAPREFNAVFAVSLCFAIVGLAVLVLFVQNRTGSPPDSTARRPSVRNAARLLGDRRFRTLVIAGSALGLVTISDGFLYLGLQDRLDFEPTFFPLLFVGSAVAYMVLAIPAGALADRIGRVRVFMGGYALLLLVYTSFLLPTPSGPVLIVYLVALGAYYAATDGVLMAIASAVLPEHQQASGLALLVTATTLAKLAAALLFGGLWTAFGLETTAAIFCLALMVACMVAWASLGRGLKFGGSA